MTIPLRHSLKTLFLLQVLFGATLSLVLGAVWGFQLGASFAVGSALMLVLVGFVALTTWLTYAKKSIAWNVMVIVIKYPVLLGSIVLLTRSNWFQSVGAGLGIASFLIAVLALAVLQDETLQQEKEKKQIGSSSL